MLVEKVIYSCWVIFVVYWFISARAVKAVAERQDWAESLIHRVPVFVGYFLLLARYLPGTLGQGVFPESETLALSGAAVCVLGMLGAIWSRMTLAGNWSGNVAFKKDHQLIERGPYRFVRHPIYTSIVTLSLGTAIAEDRLGGYAGVLLVLAGFWIKLREEEKLLTRHFPSEYPAYKKRVKALVPFVI